MIKQNKKCNRKKKLRYKNFLKFKRINLVRIKEGRK